MDILDFFWTFYLNHLSPLWSYFFYLQKDAEDMFIEQSCRIQQIPCYFVSSAASLLLINSLCRKMSKKGVMNRILAYNKYHYTWSFAYRLNPTGSNVQYLDKMDIDYVPGRDQIKVWKRSVKTYIQEATDIVSVFMKLPEQVDCIIIFHFGQQELVCYAENEGRNVYPGSQLETKPFTFNEELRRLWMSRRRRKYLY